MIHIDPNSFSSPRQPIKGSAVAFSAEFYRLVRRSTIDSADIVLATPTEVLGALALTRKLFPVAADEVALAIQAHNPECFRIVRRGSLAESAMAAYLPLNGQGAAALVEGRFDGLRPLAAHICRPGEQPEAIYSWLTYVPGKMVAGLRLLLELDFIGGGAPMFTRPAHDDSARILQMAGFLPAKDFFPSAPDWLIVALARYATNDRGAAVRVARTFDDLTKVMSIRALTYMAEQQCSYTEEFDGNDLCGTHLLGEVDGEPAGCVRIRYFAGFAKLERLAVIPEYRQSRLMWRLVQAAFDLCARKGYHKLYAHAREDLVPAWERFGARLLADRPAFSFSDVRFREMELDLPERADSLRLGTDPLVLIRPEGEWDRLGPIDRAQLRQSVQRSRHVQSLRALCA